MSRSKKGQTVLEYLILATIIMAGIVIGGPFLARSVSGHFRLLEDSVVDSVSEEIRQSPSSPLPPEACVCSKWFKGACGNGDPCSTTQRLYQRSCTPSNCDVQQKCHSDTDCCKTPVIEHCGTILDLPGNCTGPRPAPQVTPTNGPPVSVFPQEFIGTCPEATPPNLPNCKIWERLYSISCGVDDPFNPSARKTYYACKNVRGETPLDCGPECYDPTQPDGVPVPGSTACDADETSRASLTNEIDFRLNGFLYNSTRYPDLPPRGLTQWTSLPYPEMNQAYRVINTYFDPTNPNLHNPNSDQCAPGEANYGTPACHRCRPERYCEFACPAGLFPAAANVPNVGVIQNATCAPISCLKESSLAITTIPINNFLECRDNSTTCKPGSYSYDSGAWANWTNEPSDFVITMPGVQASGNNPDNGKNYQANITFNPCGTSPCYWENGSIIWPALGGTPFFQNGDHRNFKVELIGDNNFFSSGDGQRLFAARQCTGCPGHDSDPRLAMVGPGAKMYIVQFLELSNGVRTFNFNIIDTTNGRIVYNGGGHLDHFMEVIFVSCPEGATINP